MTSGISSPSLYSFLPLSLSHPHVIITIPALSTSLVPHGGWKSGEDSFVKNIGA